MSKGGSGPLGGGGGPLGGGGGPLGGGGGPGGSGVQGVVGSRDGLGSVRYRVWWGSRGVGLYRVVRIQGVLGCTGWWGPGVVEEWIPLILILLVTNHTWCVGFAGISKHYIE